LTPSLLHGLNRLRSGNNEQSFFGIICGLIFGVIDVIIMIPMKFDDKRKKIVALFVTGLVTGELSETI